MKIRATQRLLAALLVGLFSVPAVAQFTRDASANGKIDEAINSHYLMMQLDKAESLLTGTISACEDKCSPQTKAKAWMYVGIVRGSGKNDQSGAGEAFAAAKGLDPAVKLDADLASPETKDTFNATEGAAGGAAAAAPVGAAAMTGSAPGALPPPAGSPGDMLCSPQGEPIALNMPIPLSCTSDADVAEGFVKFQEPGSSEWKKVNLMNIDGMWQADIPCAFTKKAGDLKFYVGVKDANGEFVDQFASNKEPGKITLAEGGAAPAYPGQAPVTACADAAAADCPPDFPGCGNATQTCGELDWGAACKNSSECACGLLCEEGACATAPSCSADADCDTGSCVDGACAVASGAGDGPAGPFKRNWLSFTAGMDLMAWGAAEEFCDDSNNFDETYGVRCYDSEGQRVSASGVNLDSGGIVPAQLRLKLGYDYAVIDHLRLGLRLGFAFMNTHPKETGASFLPIHVEGRVTYTITPLSKGGFRPSLYAAGGLAESNGKVSTDTGIEMYRIAGRLFAAPGLSVGYAIAPHMEVNLDTQAMMVFTSGASMALVIHPALNFTYGL